MATTQLRAESFEDLINRRGRVVRWEEAMLCSCQSVQSGQANYNCKACHGTGRIYEAPIEGKAVVSDISASKQYANNIGVFQVGDALMSVPYRFPKTNKLGYNTGEFDLNPMYDIGDFDRVTLLDDFYKTSEVLVRGTALYARQADTLLHAVDITVKKIIKADEDTGAIIEFIPEHDFEVDNNKIVWSEDSEDKLAIGESYTVVYKHRPTFVVFSNLPSPRYQDGQFFPRKVVLRYLGGIAHESY